MKSLIVGMGIGKLYYSVLTQNLNVPSEDIITVDIDPSTSPSFTNIDDALTEVYDTVHICTPNFTHEEIARKVAPFAKIVFIEKPGLKSFEAWKSLVTDFPNTKFMLVKNNQFREDFEELEAFTDFATAININWINKNRIPSPGSWFTDIDKAFGGVSRDLMPHLLSILTKLMKTKYAVMDYKFLEQRWTLDDIADTNYGTCNKDGVYNVDDYCQMVYDDGEKLWTLTADWRSNEKDEINVEFIQTPTVKIVKTLGLCPEQAYATMISKAIDNIDNNDFWAEQLEMDLWIHNQI
jgi:predicted dehydrogenase